MFLALGGLGLDPKVKRARGEAGGREVNKLWGIDKGDLYILSSIYREGERDLYMMR